jgi:hypothetical protein
VPRWSKGQRERASEAFDCGYLKVWATGLMLKIDVSMGNKRLTLLDKRFRSKAPSAVSLPLALPVSRGRGGLDPLPIADSGTGSERGEI